MKKSILYTILATLAIGCISIGDSSQSKALETENVIAPKTTREVKNIHCNIKTGNDTGSTGHNTAGAIYANYSTTTNCFTGYTIKSGRKG